MSKYSFEFKLQVIKDYLEGKGGSGYLAQKYGITNRRTIREWANA